MRQRGIADALLALPIVAPIDPLGQLEHIDTVAGTLGVFAGIGLDRLLRG